MRTSALIHKFRQFSIVSHPEIFTDNQQNGKVANLAYSPMRNEFV